MTAHDKIWEDMDRRRMARLMRPGWCYDCKGTGWRDQETLSLRRRMDALNGDQATLNGDCPHCMGTGTVVELKQ